MARSTSAGSWVLAACIVAISACGAVQGVQYNVTLKPELVVPPVNGSKAHGHILLDMPSGLRAIGYKLYLYNIKAVTSGHIHAGRPGERGPIIAWVYQAPKDPFPGEDLLLGLVSEGTITPEEMCGPLDADLPYAESASCTSALRGVETSKGYVNVHTLQHPEGEIRGNIVDDARAHFEPLPLVLTSPQLSPAPAPSTASNFWV